MKAIERICFLKFNITVEIGFIVMSFDIWRSKNKDWLARNQDGVFTLGDTSTTSQKCYFSVLVIYQSSSAYWSSKKYNVVFQDVLMLNDMFALNKNTLTPDYLDNIHPLSNHSTKVRSERQWQLIPPRDRTAIYYNSFFFSATIRDWNSLPKDVLSARSVPCFTKLLQQTDKRLILFTLLDRVMNKIIHGRLRLGLSSLDEHLFKYKLSFYKFCKLEPPNIPYYIITDTQFQELLCYLE